MEQPQLSQIDEQFLAEVSRLIEGHILDDDNLWTMIQELAEETDAGEARRIELSHVETRTLLRALVSRERLLTEARAHIRDIMFDEFEGRAHPERYED
jgi:hypothetical protein